MDISISVALIAVLLFLNTIFLVALLINAFKAFSEARIFVRRFLNTMRMS